MHPVALSFVLNSFTLAFKILGMLGTNSVTVLADVLNDLGDAMGLGLLWFGLKLSKRRPKREIAYPFGFSRAIYVFGLVALSIIGGLMFMASVSRVMQAVNGEDHVVTANTMSRLALLCALGINAVSLAYTIIYFRRGRSRDPAVYGSLIDSISDSSASVLSFIAITTLSPIIDFVGGIAVSAVLLISAVSAGYRYFLILIGRAPPKEDLLKILEETLKVSGVKDVNRLRAFMVTEDEYLVIMEVEVDKDVDVEDLEKLDREIELKVRNAVPNVKHVVVEYVPFRREPPTYRAIAEEIRSLED